jgi:alpha-N-arabinofuranosidase
LELLVDSPAYDVTGMGAVSYVDAAGTYQADGGKTALFLLNRDLAKSHAVEIIWEGSSPRASDAVVLTGSDLKASNTFEAPTRVAPQKADKPSNAGGRTTFELPPRSYTVIQWSA